MTIKFNLICDEANNGDEAIQTILMKIKYGLANYWIIFMDFQMPGNDGLVVA